MEGTIDAANSTINNKKKNIWHLETLHHNGLNGWTKYQKKKKMMMMRRYLGYTLKSTIIKNV